MSRKLTTELYSKRLSQINPTIELVGNYKDAKTKVNLKCKICGYLWSAYPSHYINKNNIRGCLKCSINKNTQNARFSKEKIKNRINEISKNEYEIIDWYNYHKTSDKIKFKHIVCGHEFDMSVSNFLRGQRCPIHKYDNCNLFKMKSHDYYMNKIKKEKAIPIFLREKIFKFGNLMEENFCFKIRALSK